MESAETLHIVPITMSQANQYAKEHNEHYHAFRGHLFAIGCAAEDKLAGVVIVGQPSSKELNDGQTLAVNYICTTKGRIAYGMLYGAAARAAKAMGHHRIVGFIPENRPDSGLRAAGWKRVGLVEGHAPGRICYEQRFGVRHQRRKKSTGDQDQVRPVSIPEEC